MFGDRVIKKKFSLKAPSLLALALVCTFSTASVCLAEDEKGGSASKAAQAAFTEALQKFNAGDYQASDASYSKAIAIDPKYGKAYANRGCARYNLHQYESAIRDLDEALRYFPTNDYLKDLKQRSEGAIAANNDAAAQEQQRIANARQMLLQAQLGGDFADPSTIIMMNAQRRGLMNGGGARQMVNPFGANQFAGVPSQSSRSGTDNPFSVHETNASPTVSSTDGGSPFAVNSGPPTQAVSSGVDNPFGVTGGASAASISSSSVPNSFSNQAPADALTAKDHYKRGCDKNVAQDFANAIPEFTRSIELDPTFGDCYANRGLARFHTKDFNGALADFVSADRLIPNNPQLQQYIQLCRQMGAK
jgi:tetratricopeptide (TPR) repeat protein